MLKELMPRLLSEEAETPPSLRRCQTPHPDRAVLAGLGGVCENSDSLGIRDAPDPSANQIDEKHQISGFQAAVALFKAIVGPGILFLPSAVKNAGLLSSPIIGGIVGGVSAWCMLLLLDCSAMLRKMGKKVDSIGDVGEEAYGSYGRMAVEWSVIISQLGFCTAYCVFIAENVQSVLFEINGGLAGATGDGPKCKLSSFLASENLVYYIILIGVLPLTPLTWVRQLRYFAVTNIVASLLVVVSLAYMVIMFSSELALNGSAEDLNQFSTSGTLVFIGTAMYAWEGIGVLLPIERTMAKRSQLPWVVCLTMISICLLQIGFASVAYRLYGDKTASIITVSLAHSSVSGGTWVIVAIQVAWILEVMLTFPLQLFPAARILESKVFPERRSGQKWCKNLIRTGLLLLCVAISTIGYRSVDNLVSLIGALGCVPLAIVFPAMFHYKLRYSVSRNGDNGDDPNHLEDLFPPTNDKKSFLGPLSDLCFGLLGVVGVVLSMVLAIHAWVTSSFHFQVCIEKN